MRTTGPWYSGPARRGLSMRTRLGGVAYIGDLTGGKTARPFFVNAQS